MAKPDGITRRDLLDGAAITAAGLATAAAAPYITGAEAALASSNHGSGPLPRSYYPPSWEGLRGHTDRVVSQTVAVDGPPNPDDIHSTRGGPGIHPRSVKDTREEYDLVVVGAGISGLSSVKWYQDRFGPDARILVIDPLPDFGGHCARNEFHVPNAADGGQDLMLLRNGGAVNLDSIGAWRKPTGAMLDISPEYQRPALDLLDFCGVDPTKFPSSSTPGIPSSYGLRSMVLFPAEDWHGEDTLIANRTSAQSWADWLALTPFSQAARDAIIRIQTDTTTDWIVQRDGPKTVEEKLHILTHITYKRYLMDYLGAPEEAIVQYQRTTHGLIGVGAQAATAADVWLLGTPGFEGLGLPDPTDLTFPGIGRTAQQDNMSASGPSVAWPDGNASLVRLLVSKLIPDAFPDVDGDRPNQETIVKARCDYSQLDRRGRRTRIRLNSYVYKVRAGRGANDFASVEYVDRHGKGHRVWGAHVVMACWNRVTAQIVEDLPRPQREGLCYARKGPLIYGRAALNNWQAWADAKIASISPRGNSLFWDSTSISAGAKFGNSYGPTPNGPPSAPAMLTFQVLPTDPTRTPKLAASERGRQKLLQMSFRELENALIDVIDRSVNKSGGDFEPERDIDSIVMNRWNYGYAAEHQAVWDEAAFLPFKDQPQRKGCVPFRNVAIGNSDSQAMAYTHAAIQEGYRAVHDLPPTRCRPKGRH